MNEPTLYRVTIGYDLGAEFTLGVLKPESARVAVIALVRGWMLENHTADCAVSISIKYTDHEFYDGMAMVSTSWLPCYNFLVSNMVGRWVLLDDRFTIKSIETGTPEIL